MKQLHTLKQMMLSALVSGLAGLLTAQTNTLSGIISGNVTTEQGKSVTAAMVRLSKLPAVPERSSKLLELETPSLKDGAFLDVRVAVEPSF